MSDIRLGFGLNIEQTQKLIMTPELIQAIQILQFNTQELDSYVEEQLLTNPVLERGIQPEGEQGETGGMETADSLDWKEFIRNNQYDDISYRGQRDKNAESDEVDPLERYVSSETTLPESLTLQLQMTHCSRDLSRIGSYIIETLDENGYLTSSDEEIARSMEASVDRVRKAISIIQGFDPAGVCARNLNECLAIQVRSMGLMTDAMETIIMDQLENIANNRLSIVAKATGLTIKEVQTAADFIRTLEPKPGRQFASEDETRYIIPDVLVEKINGEYVISLNNYNSPSLIVSSYYKSLLDEAEKNSQLSEYLSDRMNSALWLIKSIEQRKNTIYNVVSAVVKHQKDFFDYGAKYLRTLTLKEIAEEVGVHESTVSRTIHGKYLQCCKGVFEIKYFFSSGVSDSMGEGVSSRSIKEFMKEIISREDTCKPYSDQELMEMLSNKGFNISRRTVAKYRDELGILSSSKRKRY